MDPLTLDDLDRRIVHALQVDGRAPFSRIGEVLGASDRTVARRYRRLRSAGAVRVVGLPHAAAIGHVDWLIRIRCTPDAAVPLATALARRADTSWVLILSGGTEISCITRTRRHADDGELLLQRLPRSPKVTAVTAYCVLRGVAGLDGWPGRTSALAPAEIAALTPARPPARPVTPTPADNALLSALARDGRADFPALARATGWSETTVRRRLDELQQSGLLYFDVDVEPALFGYHAEALLWLTVAPAALTPVTGALATHPEIGYAAAITGPANISATVICRDLDALYDYLADRVGSLPGVTGAETSPVVRRLKNAGTLLVP
ncbi:Lrp/AsnC family transcriptional regulator [Dactylosporangium matsuzakiense]|uniref:AsnC family transcriptional regulator n=1 Tax=Dactylosporangium matsuzakiense TaxID=53360 RepID=A0A9W6KS85_9ACTN|nr:Lrp/AsnC family transcriptional regulator [Dactylosporangium matsuzakiense]UWZ47906.1 Lrp/AsnC family transcriptional regulator [Dactylosporangium matsuzakiense]GLL05704.1 AsnC family transcriptional regulator [Dactylosporangium matsuzakiense]